MHLDKNSYHLNYLSENDFYVKEVHPVDMFTWMGHVETVTLITRVKG